jgi:hypothetical protein
VQSFRENDIPKDVGKLVKLKEDDVYPIKDHECPEGLEV